MIKTVLLFAIVLVVHVQTQQYPCSCSCCIGQGCPAVSYPTVYAPYCSTDSCLAQCRVQYIQCQSTPPYGQAISQCLSSGSTSNPFGNQYNCRCDCCNSGSSSCPVTFVGYTTASLCQESACSISCFNQYPGLCVSNQNGQTKGTCTGLVTTTSSTTIRPWMGNACSCNCCQGYSCSTSLVGTTSASQCSSMACTQACQSQFPVICPVSYGQTNGVCTTQTGGSTRCRCNCCSSFNTGCRDYEVITNGGCSSCYNTCQQQSPCGTSVTVTATCLGNKLTTSSKVSLSIFLSIFFYELFSHN